MLKLQGEGANDAALEYLQGFVEDAAGGGDFHVIDEMLEGCEPGDMPADIILTALSSTKPFSAFLKQRKLLKSRTQAALAGTIENSTSFFRTL